MGGKKSSIYLTDDIREKLRVPPRGQSGAVSATIERYYYLMSVERQKLTSLFNEGEWNAMRNACSSTAWTPAAMRGGVLADVQDTTDEEIDGYGAERKALEKKLAGLSIIQQFALVEMIEEFWEGQGSADEESED